MIVRRQRQSQLAPTYRRQCRCLPASRSRRAGLMMLQTIIVVTVGATVLGLAITTMHGLMSVQRGVARAGVQSITFARLNEDLRHIVGNSRTVTVSADDPSVLNCELSDATGVTLRVEANSVILLEPRQAGPPRRERYEFVPGTTFQWSVNDNPPRVRLQINQTPGSSAAGGRQQRLLIETHIGRLLAYEKGRNS